ncbi:ATP-binding protein [Candidatus Uhrbacteria bacterium]|nr:ATP-binding protein [Candidatus Uhrbacteria bacterium]
MHLLTPTLTPSVGIAASVFGLGILSWWRSRWSRGSVVFTFMAMALALWTTVDWFESLRETALPQQITAWRALFYMTAAFAPALALHASAIVGSRSFRVRGLLAYAASFALFLIVDFAFVFRVTSPFSVLGFALIDIAAVSAVIYHFMALFAVAARLVPPSYDASAPRDERRRHVYGFVLIALFLFAGVAQFVSGPLPSGTTVTILAVAFFVVASMAFLRVRLFGIDLSELEVFLLVLVSSAAVVVLQSHTLFDALLATMSATLIGVFGMMAIRAVRRETARRYALERMNRKLVSLDEEKTDFVNMVAHQLRGPLGGMRFASDMLMRGDYGELAPAARDVIRLMKNGAERLLSLAETALNAARSDAGVFRSERTETDVASQIQTLLGEVRPFAKAKGLTLEARFDGVPARLAIDAEILRNVTFNLVDNAIKYTDTGGIDVGVTMKDGRLVVSVSDTGVGLSPDDIAGLFRRFHRAGDRKRQGLGLGLFVVRRLLDAAGGSIRVESPGRGHGSVFTAEFPCGQVDG